MRREDLSEDIDSDEAEERLVLCSRSPRSLSSLPATDRHCFSLIVRSTEQTAEVAAEEVKQVQEQDIASDIVAVAPVVQVSPTVSLTIGAHTVPQSEPEAEQPVAQTESAAAEAPAAAVPAADVAATNGSAEPVVAAVAADTNGSVAAAAENGAAPESNGVAAQDAAAEVPADASVAEAESVPVDAKRKSEVGDGDSIPDSTEAKKQKVAEAPADEPVVDATA